MTTSEQPALRAIYLRPGARIPVRHVQEATAVAGVGLENDHAVGGRRQVTLLAIESWRAACAQLGQAVDPSTRRANLLTEGIDLGACIGSELSIGDVRIQVLGETRPCELLDDDGRVGLDASLRPEKRGGVFGRIVQGGRLRVGQLIG